MNILVTGGCGFIGSHTSVVLLENNFNIIIVDNLINSKIEVLRKIDMIVSKGKVQFYEQDLLDINGLEKVFQDNEIYGVIHFAGLKAVGESIEKPFEYYNNNLLSTLNLLKCMDKYGVHRLVFSSSATVYGDPQEFPIKETERMTSSHPYGKTKVMIEQMLEDFKTIDTVILRYFNPVGAHPSGLIGEDPNDIPNNLMPFILDVILKKREKLYIFGNDYQTKDGTCVRDYIHVMDLAEAHLHALRKLDNTEGRIYNVYNIGTGNGYSVLDIVKAMTIYVDIPYEFADRRAGDLEICYADPTKARTELGWEAKRTLTDICKDAYMYCMRSNSDV